MGGRGWATVLGGKWPLYVERLAQWNTGHSLSDCLTNELIYEKEIKGIVKLSSKTTIWLLLLPLVLFLTGCELAETYNETVSLRNDIQEQYGADGNLGVQYSVSTGIGKSIKIEWENSTAFSVDDPQIEEKTKELAQFVRDHYIGIDKVDKVWIVLTESQNIAIINTSHTVSFTYEIDEQASTEDSK